MPVDLISETIPPDILRRLEPHSATFAQADYLDEFYGNEDIAAILRELNDYCTRRGVVGYHYTRSFAERILENGLVAATGAERRRSFVAEFRHLFSRSELLNIEAAWAEYFGREQNRARDNRVWFNLTRDALRGTGAAPLLTYYGGEVVNMPLASQPSIAAILKTIGEPLIVSCALNTTALATFSECPWGKVWLGGYHVALNPNAYRVDFDVYTCQTVAPESIVGVQQASEYGWDRAG